MNTTIGDVELSTFNTAYKNLHPSAVSLFDYAPSKAGIKERHAALLKKSFKREELAEALFSFNKQFLYSQKAIQAIERLKDKEASVVVGGQQAGLLTGPMLVISKALSIITQAEELQKTTGSPVLPVFWIAGEDHDWLEINHVWVPGENGPVKVRYKGYKKDLLPASEQKLPSKDLSAFISEVFKHLGETEHSASLLRTVNQLAERSASVSMFFGECMRWLFKDTDLILLDANDEQIRALEKDVFTKIISDNHKIRTALEEGEKNRKDAGFSSVEGINTKSSHLFYHLPHRELLFPLPDGGMESKSGHVFSRELLMKSVQAEPFPFSSNVVTRPLTQETLLPVLAFIGGPGEVNYWSLLKPVFHALDCDMPPVLLRQHLTIIDKRVQKTLKNERISAGSGASGELQHRLDNIINSPAFREGQTAAQSMIEEIKPMHQELAQNWEEKRPAEKSFAENNWQRIQNEIFALANRIDSVEKEKAGRRLRNLEASLQLLQPKGIPQERVYSIFWLLNLHGPEIVNDMSESMQTSSEPFQHYIEL